MRLGAFVGGKAVLKTGQEFTLTARPVKGTSSHATISHPEYLAGLRPGDHVWMDDGMIHMTVESVRDGDVRGRITAGGTVSDAKGVSLPRLPAPPSYLTEKDKNDLRFGIRHGVDYVAVSFVRSASDIQEVRKFLVEEGANLPIVAKLERAEIVANLDGILTLVDAVMVARGDLGVEVPIEEVPVIQKDVIRRARLGKVPVIVATQMLESMVHARAPDARRGERRGDRGVRRHRRGDAVGGDGHRPPPRRDRRAHGAHRGARGARDAGRGRAAASARRPTGFPRRSPRRRVARRRALHAKAIVAFTQSGFTARLISQDRPLVPIIALTPFSEVQRKLGLYWGVSSRVIRKVETTDEMIEEVEATLLGDGTIPASMPGTSCGPIRPIKSTRNRLGGRAASTSFRKGSFRLARSCVGALRRSLPSRSAGSVSIQPMTAFPGGCRSRYSRVAPAHRRRGHRDDRTNWRMPVRRRAVPARRASIRNRLLPLLFMPEAHWRPGVGLRGLQARGGGVHQRKAHAL